MTTKHLLAIWNNIPYYPDKIAVSRTVCGNSAELSYSRKNEETLHVSGMGGESGIYNFDVSFYQFVLCCERYVSREISRRNQTGSYTDPSWHNPPCGRKNTPEVIPLIQELFCRFLEGDLTQG